jgi:NAD(P)H-dependent flavin oxidoreductase YrpB (nitropropane dioxygenase family)
MLIAKKWMSRTGMIPDAFVLEGPKAGGHLGFSEDHIFDADYALDKLVSARRYGQILRG